jgi:hypothetical protein
VALALSAGAGDAWRLLASPPVATHSPGMEGRCLPPGPCEQLPQGVQRRLLDDGPDLLLRLPGLQHTRRPQSAHSLQVASTHGGRNQHAACRWSAHTEAAISTQLAGGQHTRRPQSARSWQAVSTHGGRNQHAAGRWSAHTEAAISTQLAGGQHTVHGQQVQAHSKWLP